MHSNEEVDAVSPIISTILLIGICTVLASVMFVWVSGLVLQSGFVPAGEMAIMDNTSSLIWTNYTIRIEVLRPGTEPKDIRCYLCDENYVVNASFGFPSEPKIPNPFPNGGGYITWYDIDDDRKVSSDDIIKLDINSSETDLDGYSFSLRHNPTGGKLIGTVRLK